MTTSMDLQPVSQSYSLRHIKLVLGKLTEIRGNLDRFYIFVRPISDPEKLKFRHVSFLNRSATHLRPKGFLNRSATHLRPKGFQWVVGHDQYLMHSYHI